MNSRSFLFYLFTLPLILGLPLSSPAANLVVTNNADSGTGTLRAAVTTANANTNADVITFDPALTGQAILLTSQMVLSNRVTIDASALPNGVTIFFKPNGGLQSRYFEVGENAVVELNHLTMLGGWTTNSGGAIWVNANAGALTLNDCRLAHNYARLGGGAIHALGANFVLTLNRCTVSDNATELNFQGGGIYCAQVTVNDCTFDHNMASDGGAIAGGTVTVNGSSIHNNLARSLGGGLYGTIIANNSTIANNRALNGGGVYSAASLLTNCTISGNVAFANEGGIHKAGVSAWVNTIVAGNIAPLNANFFNLANVVSNCLTNGDPRLAPLGNYGGATLTMPLLAGSPALDAGNVSVTNSLAADQRGYRRLSGAHVDIGAVERQAANATNAPVLKLSFANSPDTDFTVLATTNVALPVGQWSILGRPTQNPPGEYEFTDILALDYPLRFYLVTSP